MIIALQYVWKERRCCRCVACILINFVAAQGNSNHVLPSSSHLGGMEVDPLAFER